MGRNYIEPGTVFGNWTVLSFSGINKYGASYYLCQCGCGKQKAVYGSNLIRGLSKSCGCQKAKYVSAGISTHGDSRGGNPLYRRWSAMKSRCYNPSNKEYKNYGGRGITVCDEWQKYEPFKKWALENGYESGLTIDRVDNNRGYSPDNCRWSTVIEQNNNKRNNVMVTIDGITLTKSQQAKLHGISLSGVQHRLERGWDLVDALTKQPDKGSGRRKVKKDGEDTDIHRG